MKSTGDGVLLEFPSVVDAVECVRNSELAPASREACGKRAQRSGRA